MLALAGIEPETAMGEWRSIDLHADDPESLLVLWLEELLFAIETEQTTYIDYDLVLQADLQLVGRVLAVPASRPDKPIKAVTFHDLAIHDTQRGHETVIVFDV